MELGEREKASINLKRVKSEVESGEGEEHKSGSSEYEESIPGTSSDSEVSPNSHPEFENYAEDDIKEEETKEFLSEEEVRLLLKREFKDEEGSQDKLDKKLEMSLKCEFKAEKNQSQTKKRE